MLILGPLAQSEIFLAIVDHSVLPMLILEYSWPVLLMLIQGSPWLILECSWPVLLMIIQCSACSFSAPHAHSGHPWLILGDSWTF